jgi:hypothetical protein
MNNMSAKWGDLLIMSKHENMIFCEKALKIAPIG